MNDKIPQTSSPLSSANDKLLSSSLKDGSDNKSLFDSSFQQPDEVLEAQEHDSCPEPTLHDVGINIEPLISPLPSSSCEHVPNFSENKHN